MEGRASLSFLQRHKLRRCAAVGRGTRVIGRVWIRGNGRIVVGERVLLDGGCAPIELHAYTGGEIVIGDDVVIDGGSSIEATRSVSIGSRSHIGMYCKIIDNHFHPLSGDRLVRPPAQPVAVGEDVEFEPYSIVVGAVIGKGALVGARTVVTQHVPARAAVRGLPARIG